jgi:hypothetical protein
MVEVEGRSMTWSEEVLLRYAARMVQQGLDPSPLIVPEEEPGNVYSIEAGRVRRATREMLRRRSAL